MFTKGTKPGMVLQGFFLIEPFRGQPRAVQSKGSDFWAGKAPRPELMPAGVRGPAVQSKAAPGSAWPEALRPELLPGMGRPRVGALSSGAQARAEAGVVTSPLPDAQLRLIGNGRPLDSGIRARMEDFFGADFSGVRVYEGPAAHAMGALAFTLGETLYFAPGLYDPTTREGVELLGHELTHVVQQRDGRVSNPYGHGVAIVQNPALEAEADAMGRRVAAEIWAANGQAAKGTNRAGQRYASGPAIQCKPQYEVTEDSDGYIGFSIQDEYYHINLALAIDDGGERKYHVTSEKSPKIHYYFYVDNGIVPCRPPKEYSNRYTEMFNKLPKPVQKAVAHILTQRNMI